MSEALQEHADHAVRPVPPARQTLTPMSAVNLAGAPDEVDGPGPVPDRAGAAADGAGSVSAVLRAVRETALALLDGAGTQPRRVRVKAHGISVELDWRQRPAHGTTVPSVSPAVASSGVVAVAAPDGPSDGGTGRPPDSGATAAGLHYICAPSVGTFYHAPEPGAAPFVTVGDPVTKGQPVGIVEAMKLMLPVEADRAGRVVEVLVENGASVEFGERLIAVSTSAPAGGTPGGDQV